MRRILDILDDLGTSLRWGFPVGCLIYIAAVSMHPNTIHLVVR